jgi:hypothetical protein
VAKPNYNFAKRQREIARKKKQEEKRQRKLDKTVTTPAPAEPEAVTPKAQPDAQ